MHFYFQKHMAPTHTHCQYFCFSGYSKRSLLPQSFLLFCLGLFLPLAHWLGSFWCGSKEKGTVSHADALWWLVSSGQKYIYHVWPDGALPRTRLLGMGRKKTSLYLTSLSHTLWEPPTAGATLVSGLPRLKLKYSDLAYFQ